MLALFFLFALGRLGLGFFRFLLGCFFGFGLRNFLLDFVRRVVKRRPLGLLHRAVADTDEFENRLCSSVA